MGAISDTIVKTTELSGDYKIQVLTATLLEATETIVLTEAANKISSIVYVDAHLTGGVDANLTHLQVSWSSLTITIKSFQASGAAADNWANGTVEILVIGK